MNSEFVDRAFTEEDKVYACGNNDHGQQGTNNTEACNTPRYVPHTAVFSGPQGMDGRLIEAFSNKGLELVEANNCYSAESAYFIKVEDYGAAEEAALLEAARAEAEAASPYSK